MRPKLPSPVLSFVFAAFFFTYAPALRGQQPVSSPAPDAQANKAIVTVQAALLAMQAQPATKTDVRGNIEDENGAQQGTFDWRTVGHEYQFEVRRGDHVIRFDTNAGKPKQSRDDKDGDIPFHQLKAMISVHLPGFLLLREVNDPKWNFEYLGEESYRGTSTWHVRVTNQTDKLTKLLSVQDWWFDTTTGLPVKLETRLPDKGNAIQHDVDVTRYFEWSSSDAGLVPHKLSKCESDSCRSIFQVESVDIVAGGQQ